MPKKYNLAEAKKIIAKEGGEATLKKHGKKHFKDMAKKRWERFNAKSAKPVKTKIKKAVK